MQSLPVTWARLLHQECIAGCPNAKHALDQCQAMEPEHEAARGHEGSLAIGDGGRVQPRFFRNVELSTAAGVKSRRHEARLQYLQMMKVCAAAG